MALTIGTNVASLKASAAASSVNRDLETSMARLSTGKRINSASDDAAGVAIASRLSSEIRGTDQAIRNALDGQALIDTAEGGHKEIEAILQRMREVAVQSANDTNSPDDRSNLEQEMKALRSEINRIADVTTWAGNSVMAGTGSDNTTKTFSLQVGAATGTKNQIDVQISAMDTNTLGLTETAIATASNRGDAGAVGSTTYYDGRREAVNNGALNSLIHSSISGGVVVVRSTAGQYAAINFHTDMGDVTITSTVAGGADAAGREASAEDLIAKINANATLKSAGVSAVNLDTPVDGRFQFNFTTFESTRVGTVNTRLNFSQADDFDRNGVNDGTYTTVSNAKNAIKLIDAAIKKVNTQRSELGAISNRLSHTVSNMTNISTNLSAARGGIEDADFALETTNLAKNQILQQASTAMLAQANASKQNVLSLLQ